MRLLAVVIPQAGHVTPLLPLLGACVAAGDEVIVASGRDVADQVLATGAGFHEAGSGLPSWFAALAGRIRGNPGDGLPPERIPHYFTPRLFGEIAATDMVDGALAAAEKLRPDAVLFDTEAFAGPLVAALAGALPVQHTIAAPLSAEVLELCSDALSPLWRSFGLDRPAAAGIHDGATVSILPPSLSSGGLPGRTLPLRPTPPPAAPPAVQDPPLVYVSFGTLWANAGLVRTVLAALGTLDVQVLATLGALDPADVGDVPANARVERFVPQADVLPRCSVAVNHAGAGTMLGAFAHGLPQVLLPQAADNFLNADAAVRCRAVLRLLPDQVTEDNVRDAVRQALDDPSYRSAAQSVAADIATMPGPDAVAREIRGLT